MTDADLSLVPKTISDGGRTLTLADVQWSNSTQAEADGVVTRYTATARYTGSTSSKYATNASALGNILFLTNHCRKGRR